MTAVPFLPGSTLLHYFRMRLLPGISHRPSTRLWLPESTQSLTIKFFRRKTPPFWWAAWQKMRGSLKPLRSAPGIKFMIPDQPEYTCALGAALIAAEA